MAYAKRDAQRLFSKSKNKPSAQNTPSPKPVCCVSSDGPLGVRVVALWLGPSLTSPQFVPKSGRGLISVPRTRCPTRNKRSPPPLHSSRWAPRLFHCYRRSCGERGRGARGVPRVLESLKVSWGWHHGTPSLPSQVTATAQPVEDWSPSIRLLERHCPRISLIPPRPFGPQLVLIG